MARPPDPQSASRAGFPTTDWSLIRSAQAIDRGERPELLGQFLAQYWKPIYAYYRSHGKSTDDARDLVQAFIQCHFIEKDGLARFHRSKSRFRSWIKVCARNFMFDWEKKARAKKNKPGGGLVSLDQLKIGEGAAFEPSSDTAPDAAFEEAWRRDLLEKATRDVERECQAKGRELDFEVFSAYYLTARSPRPTWKQIAEERGIPTWKAAAAKADWVKLKLAQAVRNEIRRYVESDDEVDDELRRLLG